MKNGTHCIQKVRDIVDAIEENNPAIVGCIMVRDFVQTNHSPFTRNIIRWYRIQIRFAQSQRSQRQRQNLVVRAHFQHTVGIQLISTVDRIVTKCFRRCHYHVLFLSLIYSFVLFISFLQLCESRISHTKPNQNLTNTECFERKNSNLSLYLYKLEWIAFLIAVRPPQNEKEKIVFAVYIAYAIGAKLMRAQSNEHWIDFHWRLGY